MRFLVDENLGAGLVARGAPDEGILDLAHAQGQIMIAEDKDFGALVFAGARPHSGVLLLRLRRSLPSQIHVAVEQVVRAAGNRLEGTFAVMREGVLRLHGHQSPG